MRVIKLWCIQILNGLKFLHEQNIAHRDLKCNNILYNSNTGNIIIGDFGLANRKQSNFHSIIGTPEFMAPEMYGEKYNEKVDIYAFGMCIIEMITKDTPYKGKAIGEVLNNVNNGILPKCINKIKSEKVRSIIYRCLEKDPTNRPEANELINDPFFNIIDDEDYDDDLVNEDDNDTTTVKENIIILDTQEEMDNTPLTTIINKSSLTNGNAENYDSNNSSSSDSNTSSNDNNNNHRKSIDLLALSDNELEETNTVATDKNKNLILDEIFNSDTNNNIGTNNNNSILIPNLLLLTEDKNENDNKED